MPIQISTNCTGCGACIKDCPTGNLELSGNRAVTNNGRCLVCAHCVAVCPAGAVSIDAYDMTEALPCPPESYAVDAAKLLNLMRARRSIRRFAGQPVEQEKIERIIEAGRYAPTASNLQKNRFIIVREQKEQLKKMVLEQLAAEGQRILDTSQEEFWRVRAKVWIKMHEDYVQNPNSADKLFFNAPEVLVLVSNSDRDGGIAASYMELLAAAEGLGMLYSGYTSMAANSSDKIKKLLNIAEKEIVVLGMMIGYPDVRYARIAPRHKAQITNL